MNAELGVLQVRLGIAEPLTGKLCFSWHIVLSVLFSQFLYDVLVVERCLYHGVPRSVVSTNSTIGQSIIFLSLKPIVALVMFPVG